MANLRNCYSFSGMVRNSKEKEVMLKLTSLNFILFDSAEVG